MENDAGEFVDLYCPRKWYVIDDHVGYAQKTTFRKNLLKDTNFGALGD